MKPTVYLLCGLPGSGKSTFAKQQETKGVIRLTLDEELFKRFGREFPSERYAEYEAKTKSELKEILKKDVENSKSVMLDYGFWKKAEREEYKQFIDALGVEWQLLYFKIPENVLRDRLRVRNQKDIENNHDIDESLLEAFSRQFEPPLGEGEQVIEE